MSTPDDQNTLLVPIRIDALAVGESLPSNDLFQWTNLTPDFSKFRTQDDYLFGWELSRLFEEQRAAFMAPGIHLHFRLPRAFTHGIQRDLGRIVFPMIPNRWLVQRFCAAPVANYRAWLIKSDAEAAEPWTSRTPGVTWPMFCEGRPAEFRAIGLCTELTGPVDEGHEAASLELTAVGPGDPSFSAHYPACRSVLGFHDNLVDVPAGTHPSYLVTGWYSEAKQDPLQAFVASFASSDEEGRKRLLTELELEVSPPGGEMQALEAWLKSRNWQCDALAGAKRPPGRLVCHGVVRGVAWEGKARNYLQASGQSASDGRVDIFPLDTDKHKQAYRVAVGEAPGEALAALCVGGEVDQDLLTALQAGLLSQDVAISDLRYQLHERRFGGLRGGTVFVIQPEPDRPNTMEATDRPPPHPPSTVLPGPLHNALRELNEKQAAYDRHQRRVDDCTWQLYACWYLWTAACRGPGPGSPGAKQRKRQLDSFERLLDSEKQARAAAKSARDDCKTAIEITLKDYPKTRPDGSPRRDERGEPELMYHLSESTQKPFQEPNDPVIAVAGPAMARLNTWQQIEALPCRLSKQVVTGFRLAVSGEDVVEVTGSDLADTLFASPPDPGGIHGDLLRESLLLDPRNAADIAGRASGQQQVALTRTVQSLQDPESTSAQQAPASPPNALFGDLPYRIAAFDWKGNPWIPLFLVWEVSWQSDYPTDPSVIAPDVVEKCWSLTRGPGGEGDPDLTFADGARGRSRPAESVTYRGRSILTPSASKNLADKLEALDGKHPLIDGLRNRPVMSQALDGFHGALMLRRTGAQLPPLDFKRWDDGDDGDALFLDPILAALNAGLEPDLKKLTFGETPAANGPFLPIRAGRLRIERLRVIDAFGQTVKLPVREINASSDAMLRRSHNTAIAGSAPAEIALRPRFTPAMRLRFDLECAGPDAGPVCGWILPNHMEQSLAIYSATGQPLGAFQKKLNLTAGIGAKGFYWVDFPGAGSGISDAPAADPAERLRGVVAEAHLRHFCTWILGLSADESGYFSTLLNRIIEATDQRVPDDDPGVSVLVGRPLALARASLRFEGTGIAAHSPELVAAAKTVEEAIETRGFERVRWPVRLGDSRARNDGLIGVFACAASGTTAGPFYPTWGQDSIGAASGKFGTQNFSLDCIVPLQVTMLMDPQARVHATTGALPRVSLELPTDIASGAKRARDVFFQTAPVLGESPTPHMPRPSDDYGQWSWAYRPDVTSWREDPNLIEATDRGAFSETWPAIAEGCLKLRISPLKVLSLWVREGTDEVSRGANIHLAWSLEGAEALELESVPEGGGDAVTVKKWSSPPFPREYPVKIEAPATYRLTATAAEAEPSSKEITIRLKDS